MWSHQSTIPFLLGFLRKITVNKIRNPRREQSLFVGQLISTLDFSGRQKKALLRQGLHLPDQHSTTFGLQLSGLAGGSLSLLF